MDSASFSLQPLRRDKGRTVSIWQKRLPDSLPGQFRLQARFHVIMKHRHTSFNNQLMNFFLCDIPEPWLNLFRRSGIIIIDLLSFFTACLMLYRTGLALKHA